jgi:NitT/TauT family transport system substrate-binding protein
MMSEPGHTSSGKLWVQFGAALVVAAALSAGVYAWLTHSQAAPTGAPEPLTLAVNTVYAGSCSILAAQEEGYFAQEGLQVTLQPYTNGKDALEATLQGKANLGTSADIPLVFAVMRGQPVSIIATIFATSQDYSVVGRLDRGVTTPAELRGKRIGVTQKTSGHFVLDAFLNRQKLSVNDVTLVDYKPEDLAAALAKGEVDAAATWEPYVGQIKEQVGANGRAFSTEGIYSSIYNLSGTRDYVAGHGEAIKKLLRALVRGGQFCQDNVDRALAITAKSMQTDAGKLKGLWPGYQFGITLDQSLLLALEDETRWAVKNQLTAGRANMPNYLDHIELNALAAVQPAAVTVIH